MTRKLLAFGLLPLILVGCRPEGGPPRERQRGGGAGPEVVLTEANFDAKVLESDKPVMVDFYATWCGPCQDMAPIVEELAAEFQGRAVIGKVNGDENRALVRDYRVPAYPTFLFFKKGALLDQVVGATSKAELVRRLDALVERE
jgi:thioredoxin 1